MMKQAFIALVPTLALSAGLSCAGELNADVKDEKGAPIVDAVVLANPLQPNKPIPTKVQEFTVDQIDKEFVPQLTVVPLGASVKFPNRDNIRHQIYSFSEAKRFELPLYTGTPVTPIVFDKPGIVKLGCNIHDWMLAYIYVTDTPYFASTSKDGKARLAKLPPGEYDLQIWHPRLEKTAESTQKRIVINAGTSEVAWKVALESTIRPRRAPTTVDQGYR